ncbi:High mobility group box domain [Dillenia turbinata]|uniref:RING-type E3 ubiquitin transferase n=1 Tax=Dillenia turbinata TaxID=194707 RepID=A0AAN8YUI0_9MAGN
MMFESSTYCMVPSEGKLIMGKRKLEDCIGSEGNKKKKKKMKHVSMPRPACSWVHFSREFIKEYSASHPESSGLKAATKAASDAWKSMSIEEKDKYNKRAREVWDNYLKTAPFRVPRPRKQTKLVTRCSPGRLHNVLQSLTPDQKTAVKTMGFGSLLGLRCRTLRRSLCLWLLERFNTASHTLEICGERIPLCPQDVEVVMGLAASGKEVVNSGPDDLIAELRQSYNATNHGISLRLLEERLAVPEAGEDFKRSFVLYALGTLLCPTARLDVSPSFLHFLTNMDVIHQYNWGKFLLDRLVREVSRFHQGKQRAVGGCLLFLQLFYYESISIGGIHPEVCDNTSCLNSWGEEEITEREKQEKELGGYGSGEVICKDRCLKGDPVVYEAHVNGQRLGKVGSAFEHGPALGLVGSKVVLQNLFPDTDEGDRKDGEIITDEAINSSLLLNSPLLLYMESANRILFELQLSMQEKLPVQLEDANVVCGDIIVVPESVKAPCRNTSYGCTEIVDYMEKNDHEETCMFAPCTCPIRGCNFIGSSEQLSLHFGSKHWDSGRRFQYNFPLSVSLGMQEPFLVLQAEEDGILFLLRKGIETIGNTLAITRIAPISSSEKFLYDLVSERGKSSLRLKSCAENFPGQVEGSARDFLLVPFDFLSSSGQLKLEVCIRNSIELGGDCP